MSTIEGVPVLCLPPRALGPSARFLKRWDGHRRLSTLALVLLSPLFPRVALLIKLDSRGPVFFHQPRVGVGGREFEIVKFRTMVRDADEQKETVAHLNKHATATTDVQDPGRSARDARREVPAAHLARRAAAALNVLRGQMSLVGPRPLIPSEDLRVEDWGEDRLSLRPGMTGLWQVLGRSEIPFGEMVRLDYLYVTNWSLWYDLRLICGTVPAMLTGGEGAY